MQQKASQLYDEKREWCRVNFHTSGGEEVCSHQGAPEQLWWVWMDKGGRGRQNRLIRWMTLVPKQDKQEKGHVGKPQNGIAARA